MQKEQENVTANRVKENKKLKSVTAEGQRGDDIVRSILTQGKLQSTGPGKDPGTRTRMFNRVTPGWGQELKVVMDDLEIKEAGSH